MLQTILNRFIPVAICCVIIFTGVAGIAFAQGDEGTEEPLEIRIVDIIGTAILFRDNTPYAIVVGLQIGLNDIIEPASNSRITIDCGNGDLDFIQDVARTPCPDVVAPPADTSDLEVLVVAYRDVTPGGVTRSAGNALIARVLAPRNTRLIDPRPEIRWQALPGAVTYTVNIQRANQSVVTIAGVSGTSAAFPESDPDLEPGVYSVEIIPFDADGERIGSSAVDANNFRLLDAESAQEFAGQLSAIQSAPVPAGASATDSAYLPAFYLYQQRLYAESESIILEALEADRAPTGEIYALLGRIYLDIGLSQLAQDAYAEVLSIAQATDDPDLQAIAYWGLGTLSVGEDQHCLLGAAIDLYTELGVLIPEDLERTFNVTPVPADGDCASVLG